MIHRPFSHSENSAKITNIPRVDQWSETTTCTMQHGKLRTDRCPWFIDWLFQLSYTHISSIFTAGGCNSNIASSVNTKLDYVQPSMGRPVTRTNRNRKQKKNIRTTSRRPVAWPARKVEIYGTSCGRKSSSIQGRTASSSRESATLPLRKAVSGKHSIHTHLPKDRKCDICMRTNVVWSLTTNLLVLPWSLIWLQLQVSLYFLNNRKFSSPVRHTYPLLLLRRWADWRK